MNKIKVGVIGACGKMGREICKNILKDPELQLTAAFDVTNNGNDIGTLVGLAETGVKIETNLVNLLENKEIDVMVDFTNAQAVINNIPKVIEKGINVVIGTTGLTKMELDYLDKLAKEENVGLFVAPNFAIGAILMMRFAREAAKYFPHVEIIELHHDQKLDAPSGTAIKTLEEIAKSTTGISSGT